MGISLRLDTNIGDVYTHMGANFSSSYAFCDSYLLFIHVLKSTISFMVINHVYCSVFIAGSSHCLRIRTFGGISKTLYIFKKMAGSPTEGPFHT